MAISKRHAVTVLLTEDHLRKMIDNHLLKEEDIADRVKVARIVQKLLSGALNLPDRPSASRRIFDLNGETKVANTKHISANIPSIYVIPSPHKRG